MDSINNVTWFNANEHINNGYKSPEQILNIIRRGIFLDTAPLYILVCGHYDKLNGTYLIEKFDCEKIEKDGARKYTLKDYNSLIAFLNSFDLKKTNLFVTPQIFTEFIQHLWKEVNSAEQFNKILESSFKDKLHIKDINHCDISRDFLENQNFIKMELEIGDVSILICANVESKNMKARTILTTDKQFAILSANKYKFHTLFFDEIRNATLNISKIPDELLAEP